MGLRPGAGLRLGATFLAEDFPDVDFAAAGVLPGAAVTALLPCAGCPVGSTDGPCPVDITIPSLNDPASATATGLDAGTVSTGVGAAHDWFGSCRHAGIGLGTGSGYSW
ncbi:MAG: hypothetical protein ACKORY_02220, partial [Actinomycetota bacterium]